MTSTRPILLAEDNSDDAFLTMRAMESAGITRPIHHCQDGQLVINYLEKILADQTALDESRQPDLILLDLKMPRLGGLETLKWIRNHNVFHSLVVLALTSSSEQKDVSTAYALQVNAYLVKPSSLSEMVELARAIRHFWLDQNHLIKPRINLPTTAGVAHF